MLLEISVHASMHCDQANVTDAESTHEKLPRAAEGCIKQPPAMCGPILKDTCQLAEKTGSPALHSRTCAHAALTVITTRMY